MNDFLSSPPLRALGTRDDIAGLAAINTTILKNGALVFVTGLADYFYLVKDSTAAADGATIIASATGSPGRWFRMFAGGGQSFATQSDWYIDPVAGDDGNDGETSLTALATMGELQRRLNGAYINQVTTIHILNDVPANDEFLPTIRIGSSGQLIFSGENTTLLTAQTLTGVQAEVPAANTRGSITVAGFDWTPYIGKRLRITAGGTVGAIGWLQKIGGVTTTAFVNRPTVPTSFVSSTFTNGDTVAVEDLVMLGRVSLDGVSVTDQFLTTGGPVLFQNLKLSQPAITEALVMPMSVAFLGCDYEIGGISQFKASGTFSGSKFSSTVGSFGSPILSGFNISFYGCWLAFATAASISLAGGALNLFANTSVTGASLNILNKTTVTMTDLGIWDWTQADRGGISLLDSFLDVVGTGRVWGTSAAANTFGISVSAGEFRYRSAQPPTIAGALGGTKDVQIGGTSGTYAILPYVNPNNQSRIVVDYAL